MPKPRKPASESRRNPSSGGTVNAQQNATALSASETLDAGRRTEQAPDRMGAGMPEATARRAYERYQTRGATHGRDQEDWFEAERELNRRENG